MSLGTLSAETNFSPEIIQGKICFPPAEARELLNAYNLVPLLESKISNLYLIQDENDSTILYYQNQEYKYKKDKLKAGFIGAGIGSAVTGIAIVILKIFL